MRYYGFKLGTNVEEIKENAKIELQHYGYNNTLESINSYMYQQSSVLFLHIVQLLLFVL